MTDTEPHATLPAGTALLAEVIYASTNLIDDTASFHLVFEADAVGSNPTPAAVTTALITRLNFPQGSASFAITAWLAPSVDRGSSSSKINIYDISAHLDGTPHGSPIYTAAWDPAAMHPTSVQPVPDGVAGVISYRSDYGTDPEFGPPGSGTKPGARARPRATHRNRIYMGPLNSSALAFESTTQRCVLSSTFLSDAMQWILSLDELGTTPGCHLAQWSKKDARLAEVVQAWIDDRPDYQRRRSDPSTMRTQVTFP